MNKSDFLQLMIDYLSINPDKRKDLYKELMALTQINYSSEVPQITPITQDEIDNSTTLIQQVANRIDWSMLEDTEFGEDEFFNGENGLYTSLKNALVDLNGFKNDYTKITDDTDIWQDFWNDSVANLMKLLAEKIDPESVRDYERSGLLIEITEPPEDEGMIDTEHLRASIAAHGAVAELRMIDIMDADAGYSFADANDVYEYLRFYSYVKVTKGNHSYEGKNVLFGEEANKYFGPLEANPTQLNSSQAQEFSNSVRSGVEFDDENEEYVIPAQAGTYSITGTYKIFKVVKNPWVVPWYNVDGETYSRVRGSDKKLSVLCDEKKLGFTRTQGQNKWIRLIMPQYQRKVEIEDLNRDFWVIGQVLAGISIYLFDEDSPLNKMIKGLLKEIGELWENVAFLWAALALLGQHKAYDKTHKEVVVINMEHFSKRIDFDHFEDSFTEEEISSKLEYLIDKYSNHNLAIVPYVRLNNYQRNYYESVWLPGVWIYDRNKENAAWDIHPLYKDEEMTQPLIISVNDYKDYIVGIQEQEDVYKYVTFLSNADSEQTTDETRFYGLLRDNIQIAGEVDDTHYITVKIEFHDIGAGLIGRTPTLIYSTFQYINYSGQDYVDYVTEINSVPFPADPGIRSINISKGYYQGELLSTYDDAVLNHHIEVECVEMFPYQDGDRATAETNQAARIATANEVLQKYFEEEIVAKGKRDISKFYVMISHYYYAGTDNPTHGTYTYYTVENSTLVPHQGIRGSQGIDLGLVIYMPGSNTPYVFGTGANNGAMWTYSEYNVPGAWAENSEANGASAYRFELYTKHGLGLVQEVDDWYLKIITMANIEGDHSDLISHPDAFYHSWRDKDKRFPGSTIWHSGRNPKQLIMRTFFDYAYLQKSGSNTIPRLYSYKIEKDDPTTSGDLVRSTPEGTLDINLTDFPYCQVQKGYSVQQQGEKNQILGINYYTPNTNPAGPNNNMIIATYPDYDAYPYNGYTR